MRTTLKILSVALGAITIASAHAQTAISRSPAAKGTPGGVSFHYDAQHDQVIAEGIQLKPTATGAASIAPTTGTLVVTINITAVSHFRHGTTYHCSLTAIGGELDTTNGVVSGGIETATGIARWNGVNTLACTLTIPYEWTILPDPAATAGAVLAFGVSAVAPAADGGTVQRSTLQVDGVEPIPPSGATSTFAFNVTL